MLKTTQIHTLFIGFICGSLNPKSIFTESFQFYGSFENNIREN